MDSSTPFYPRSPVVERVISIFADVPEEIFERGFENWSEKIKPHFPVYEPLKEWKIPIRETKTETGEIIPVLDENSEPILQITHRFSKKTSKEGFDWSIRCPAGQFTMNMHSQPDQESQKRRYENLRTEAGNWVPLWLQLFEVKRIKRITLLYMNILNSRTLGNFYDQHGAFRLGDALTIFSHIPGDYESLTSPYQSTITLKLRGYENAHLRVTIGAWPEAVEPAVKVTLQASMTWPLPHLSASAAEIFPLLDWLHSHIVNQFENTFTPEAKKSFGEMPT